MSAIDSYWRSYIDGRWVDAADGQRRTLIDPATAEPLAEVALAGEADVDAAVTAARGVCSVARAGVGAAAERLRWVMGIGRELASRRDRAAVSGPGRTPLQDRPRPRRRAARRSQVHRERSPSRHHW